MAQKYEEKDTVPKIIDSRTLLRRGGTYSFMFKDEMINDHTRSVIDKATDILDTYRFKVLVGSMDKGPVAEYMASKSRAGGVIKAWDSMTVNIETQLRDIVNKITPAHKGVAMFLMGIITRNFDDAKFNRLHSMAKLSKAISTVKILGPDLNEVTDIIFIYTADGIESTQDIKKLYGTIDYKNYPNYWDLYTALKYSELLGYKIFNIGKEGMITGLESFLQKEFDPTKTPNPTIGERHVQVPPYYKDLTLEELFSKNSSTTTEQARVNASSYSSGSPAVSEINMSTSQTVSEANTTSPSVDTPPPKINVEEENISF